MPSLHSFRNFFPDNTICRKSTTFGHGNTSQGELIVKALSVAEIDKDLTERIEEKMATSSSKFNYMYKGKSYYPLPVVDVNGLDDSDPSIRANIVKQIHDVGKELGTICLVNHGIPVDVLHGFIKAGKTFFELPREEKIKCKKIREEGLLRPVGYEQQFKDLTEQQVVQRREVFEIQSIPAATRCLTPWPKALPEFKEYAEVFGDGQFKLACWVCDALSEGLGLPRDAFRKQLGDAYHQQMITSYYIPVSSQSRDAAGPDLGFGAHSDAPFFNVVMQDEVGGLQAFLDGEWKDLPPTGDGVTFFLGEPVECLSNGEYHAAVHRVLSPKTQNRLSFISTFEPFDKETLLRPAPELGPAKYKSYVYGERLRSLMGQRFHPSMLSKDFMLMDSSSLDETRNFSYRDGIFRLGGVPLREYSY